ncbi:MAG TPA: HAMP domain-containing sensor histidine kinase [Gemmatimonadales bacterium]|nr:HAMP domain-containing sensor histidine kinase [Gemmatimonadales bacterium]
MASKPWLRTELVFHLTFLAAAALLVGVATVLVASSVAPERAFVLVMLLVALEVAVFVVFGRYLVNRLVLWPLERVVATADAVADGDLGRRAPDAETQDFSTLAERLNRMTDHLLDAQSQLVRSEKLASIGRLAAGIAHEVGNPLGAVGTYVEVLRRRGADPAVVAGVTRELERIDQIVRGLLDYARPQDEALAALDPAEVMRSAYGLLDAQGALKAVRPCLEIASGLPRILGCAHFLEQAIVNLVLNAVDAAPGGIVVLGARAWAYEPRRPAPKRDGDPQQTSFLRRIERRPVRAEFAAGQPGALLYIADSGTGVPEVDRDRIFEPFYTTKEPGRGTGLGLAIVARAVHDMGGVVWVDTAREGGAAFKMFFPEAAG